MEKLYVAYGSNLNIKQMKYRCPTSKLYDTGVLKGYELQFKGSPYGAYATVAPKEGSSVPVAVWKIRTRDEWSLDQYEGYPTHYFKKNVSVQLEDKKVNAMVYIMNLKMDFGMPSPQYYQTVLQGYRDCGLDTEVLEQAVTDSTQKFYSEYGNFGRQQSLFKFNGEDKSDVGFSADEFEEIKTDEYSPFFSSDGVVFGGR